MDNFKKDSISLLTLTAIASGVNYLCQIFMGRVLSVESFGVMTSIFTAILVLSVPGTSLNMLTAKETAALNEDISEIQKIILRMTSISVKLGGYIFAFVMLTSPAAVVVLKTDWLLIFISGIAVVTSFMPYVISGALSGLHKFLTVGFMSLIVPIFKMLGVLISAFISTSDYIKMNIIVIMIILGNMLTLIFYNFVLDKKCILNRFPIALKNNKISDNLNIIYLMLTNFLYLVLINTDIFFVTVCIGSASAGMYGAVMMFGRIIYYFTTALVTVLLPYVSSGINRGVNTSRVLRNLLLITTLLSILFMTPINLFPEFFIRLLYGEKYLYAIQYLFLSCAVAVVFSLINLELNYFVGVGKTKKIFKDFLISLTILNVLMVCHHSSTMEILINILIVLTSLFAYELICSFDMKAIYNRRF